MPATENWGEKCERLARELKEMQPDPFKSTPKQRDAYRVKSYELKLHLDRVP